MSVLYSILDEIRGYSVMDPPHIWPITPERMAALLVECTKDSSKLMPPFDSTKPIHILGHRIVVIPFADDPKFKTFKSMAALAGAKIHYEFNESVAKSASFISIEHGDTIQYLPCSPALRISRVRRVGLDSMEFML